MKEINNTEPLLSIKDFSLSFRMYDKGVRQSLLNVLSNLNLSVNAGEIVAVFGSSGSGKSLLAQCILGIQPSNGITSGTMTFMGSELTKKKQADLRGKEIALVPQSVEYLDPLMKVGEQVAGTSKNKTGLRNVFKRYSLSEKTSELYPYQLSGGMARRVLISTAVIGNAKLIVADEPTPGLSPDLAKEVLKNLRDLADSGCGIILITHDIDLALPIADKIAVFYSGSILEITPKEDFIKGGDYLRHPYSKALWNALPENGFQPIPGTQPYAGEEISGCLFAPRCSKRSEHCTKKINMRSIRGGEVCCIYAT